MYSMPLILCLIKCRRLIAKAGARWPFRPQRSSISLLHLFPTDGFGQGGRGLGCAVDLRRLSHGNQAPGLQPFQRKRKREGTVKNDGVREWMKFSHFSQFLAEVLPDDFRKDFRGADSKPGDELRPRRHGRGDERDRLVGHLHRSLGTIAKTRLGICGLFVLLHDVAFGLQPLGLRNLRISQDGNSQVPLSSAALFGDLRFFHF